ncbi:DUF3413 domain-containing protein [Psittacicella gerlachiana]|uniref:Inner membrane protein YejM N-terminal domain-containing protein n=1 Tax=Psittacicella gerlachiana TaxID=2028574 RepID=A0A3A1YIC6_9GAMM|nr:DUF3413 domain-containing protein [Psittacicella gerlachiana]RIY37425.1 hypothetical protein CKF59_01835 [Psittacicella gerlachiana]
MHILLNSTEYLSPKQRRLIHLRWTYWFVLCNLVILWILGAQYLLPLHFHSTISSTYYLATLFSHFFLLAVISGIVPIIAVFIFTNGHYYRMFVGTYYTLLIMLLALDQAVYNHYQEHLSLEKLIWLLVNNPRYQEFYIYFAFLPLLLLCQLLFGVYIWRRVFHLHLRSRFNYVFMFIMLVFVIWSNTLYVYAVNTNNFDLLIYRSVFPLMFYFRFPYWFTSLDPQLIHFTNLIG